MKHSKWERMGKNGENVNKVEKNLAMRSFFTRANHGDQTLLLSILQRIQTIQILSQHQTLCRDISLFSRRWGPTSQQASTLARIVVAARCSFKFSFDLVCVLRQESGIVRTHGKRKRLNSQEHNLKSSNYAW